MIGQRSSFRNPSTFDWKPLCLQDWVRSNLTLLRWGLDRPESHPCPVLFTRPVWEGGVGPTLVPTQSDHIGHKGSISALKYRFSSTTVQGLTHPRPVSPHTPVLYCRPESPSLPSFARKSFLPPPLKSVAPSSQGH